MEKKKEIESKDSNLIVLDKKTVENYFFAGIAILALGVFIYLLIMSIVSIASKKDLTLESEKMQLYQDDYLNVRYTVPGGTWVFSESDTEQISKVVDESKGEDNYFDLNDDSLKEEVISLMGYNDAGVEGYREFISFSFRPTFGYGSLEDEGYIETVTNRFLAEFKDIEYIESVQVTKVEKDKQGGIMLKAKVVQKVDKDTIMNGLTEEEKAKLEEEGINDFDGVRYVDTYYSQYIRVIGKNFVTATYGTLGKYDDAVDNYIRYFLSSLVTEKQMLMPEVN